MRLNPDARVIGSAIKSLFADPKGAFALVRRLLIENALPHWRRYAVAYVLMAIMAGCTAASAYLLGSAINQAYVNRSFAGVTVVAGLILLLSAVKGFATYGQAVMLARIGARIVAENQRRTLLKLLNEGLPFFGKRHSSEFLARLTTGANSASVVVNLLVSAAGRDLLTVVGTFIVMVIGDPLLLIMSLVVVAPSLKVLRKLIRRINAIAMSQFTGGAQIMETMQETVQGIRTVKAFTLEEQMRTKFDASVGGLERD